MGDKSQEENPADLNVIQRQNAEEAERQAKEARDAQSQAQGQPTQADKDRTQAEAKQASTTDK